MNEQWGAAERYRPPVMSTGKLLYIVPNGRNGSGVITSTLRIGQRPFTLGTVPGSGPARIRAAGPGTTAFRGRSKGARCPKGPPERRPQCLGPNAATAVLVVVHVTYPKSAYLEHCGDRPYTGRARIGLRHACETLLRKRVWNRGVYRGAVGGRAAGRGGYGTETAGHG